MPPAVILAAGESSRFWPLSTHGQKALHRVGGLAVIEHTVRSLQAAGVQDVLIVQSPLERSAHFPHRTVADQLGDGSQYGVQITYLEQPDAQGPGPALRLAVEVIGEEFFVVQPETVSAGQIVKELWEKRGKADTAVAAETKHETWLFGVLAIDGDLMTDFVEKPEPGTEPSNLCNTGIHLLGPKYAATLRQEPFHEHMNVHALATLCKSKPVRVVRSAHEFFPLKYPWHLFAIAKYVAPERYIGKQVTIGEGVEIDQRSSIERDSVIGNGVAIRNALIGAGCRINSPVDGSIIAAGVVIDPDVTIKDRHLDGGAVAVDVKGHSIDTSLTELGCVIGQGTHVHAGAVIEPGVLIGAECEIKTGAHVTKNVPDRTTIS